MREDYIYVVYTRHIPGIYRKSGFKPLDSDSEPRITVTGMMEAIAEEVPEYMMISRIELIFETNGLLASFTCLPPFPDCDIGLTIGRAQGRTPGSESESSLPDHGGT